MSGAAFMAALRPAKGEVAIFVRSAKPEETGPCAVLSVADATTLHAALGCALGLASRPGQLPHQPSGDALIPFDAAEGGAAGQQSRPIYSEPDVSIDMARRNAAHESAL